MGRTPRAVWTRRTRWTGAGRSPVSGSTGYRKGAAIGVSGLVLLVAIALPLGGCVRHEEDVPTLRAWTMWGGDEADAFQAVVDAFNSERRDFQVRNLAAVDDARIIRAIVAGDPPDLFTLRDPGYLGSLAATGALRPLDEDFVSSGLREQDFAPGALSLCRFRGRLYAMVFLMDCFGLIWNPACFREAGLDPDRPPQTMEELLDTARRLTRRDDRGRVTRLGLAPPEPIDLYGAFGGPFLDESGRRPAADHPAHAAALRWLRELIQAQGGAEEVNRFTGAFGQEMGINNPFLMGKTAMLIGGQWNPYWFHRYGPHVTYRVAPIPVAPGRRPAAWLGGNLFCIAANSRRPRQAWQFLRWSQTDRAQLLFAQHMKGIPNLVSSRRARVLRVAAGPDEAWKAGYAAFLDVAALREARHFPVTPVSGLYQYELRTAADYVRFGSRTPEAALAGVQARVSREIRAWQ